MEIILIIKNWIPIARPKQTVNLFQNLAIPIAKPKANGPSYSKCQIIPIVKPMQIVILSKSSLKGNVV